MTREHAQRLARRGTWLTALAVLPLAGVYVPSRLHVVKRCVTVTGIVGVLPEVPEPLGVVATLPTEETTPGVLAPSGSVMLTLSPAFTSLCWEASSAIITTFRSDVAVSTGPDAGLPRLPGTVATRSAAGSNTTDPGDSDPGGLATPRAASSLSTPALLRQEQ